MKKHHVMRSKRRAGLVRRYHVWDTIRAQSTGEHTWQVLRIYVECFGSPRPEVTEHIVFHDTGEVQVGDLPYPVKADNPGLKREFDALEDRALADMGVVLPALSEEEQVRFKFCDLLECAEHALDEVLRGNQFMLPVLDQAEGLRGYLAKMSTGDRTRAVHYCGRAGVPLDRDYLHSVNPLLCNAYDEFYRESAHA